MALEVAADIVDHESSLPFFSRLTVSAPKGSDMLISIPGQEDIGNALRSLLLVLSKEIHGLGRELNPAGLLVLDAEGGHAV
jgi:hypothetical protein